MSTQKLVGNRMGLYLLNNRARRRQRNHDCRGWATPMLEELESRVLMSATHGMRQFTHTSSAAKATIHKATTNYVVAHKSSAAAGTPSDGLGPTAVKTAYGINSISFSGTTGDGTGQTIAIVDAYNDPNITADLHTFDVAYGLSDPTLVTINENGGRTLPSTDPSGPGSSWAMEISLDVEWAHAIAPGAKIVLVEASSSSDSDLMKAVNTARNYAGVSVVSLSWGSSESSTDLSENQYFTTPSGHTNITFVASSGDNGAYGDGNPWHKTVEYPAASANVIAVGGTSLTVDSSGNYVSESAWGSGYASRIFGGSGGGVSTVETQPAYQSGVVTQSTTYRAVPDVAAVADPNTGVSIYDSWDSPSDPWTIIGGTSLSAPIWAAIIAVADQGRVAAGESTLTTNQALTLLYSAPKSDFNDVTTGNNGYSAGVGYDLTTGLGTPIANRLVPYLVGTTSNSNTTTIITTTPASAPSIAALTPSESTLAHGDHADTRRQRRHGYPRINHRSHVLPRNQRHRRPAKGSDTVIGTGTNSGSSWAINTSTAGLAPGTHTYYAVATDSTGASSVVASTTVTVVSPSIGSLTVSSAFTTIGSDILLTAANVEETAGTISSVSFYLESNGTDGLQSSTDTLLGTGVGSGGNWTFNTTTAGLAPGKYTYYAVATDAGGNTSTTATATMTVVSGSTIVASVNNDNFSNATILSGTSITATGSNTDATRQKGEPAIGGKSGGKSIWYSWTAPTNGSVSVDTSGSGFDTLLGVYTGSSVAKLTKVASNDDASPGVLTSAVGFKATAGTTYYIAVDGYHGANGSSILNIQETPRRPTIILRRQRCFRARPSLGPGRTRRRRIRSANHALPPLWAARRSGLFGRRLPAKP